MEAGRALAIVCLILLVFYIIGGKLGYGVKYGGGAGRTANGGIGVGGHFGISAGAKLGGSGKV